MKSVSISGSLRKNVGKKDAKATRIQGMIPCVLYGGEKQIHFSADEKAFNPLVYTPEVFTAELNIDGNKHNAILQALQIHPVTDKIIHLDFLEIFPDKPVKIDVPVKVAGISPGVLKGGKLQKKLRTLKIKGLPQHLPDFIEVNIDKLDIGHMIKISEINVDNIELLNPANAVVVRVIATRAAAAATSEPAK
ncbi:MAG: 50S ribosomal protein L25/general stress protein Ctc [Bacteroidota bacterium]|nr:50S ribosomal protein L25/general stress protein Ctc [Bacteroidota bacterium]